MMVRFMDNTTSRLQLAISCEKHVFRIRQEFSARVQNSTGVVSHDVTVGEYSLQAGLFVLSEEFADGAVGLIDGDIGIRAYAGIGVGNGDAPKRFAANDPRLLSLFPVWLK
jgi:hypothetical protein